jgi:Zn-dependent M28 family amino/carboxypeptidase
LSERESRLAEELERDVNELSVSIGERNPARKWEFASASDYVAGQFEAAGYSIDRQGYEVDGVTAQNLGVEVTGAKVPDEIVVVGAHYDSPPGSPGANDDATGSAAVLALAREFRVLHPDRTIRFVAFGTGQAPYYGTEQMGSLVYAKRARVRGEKLVGVVGVGSIGCYTDAPQSQRKTNGDPGAFSDVGDFVAVFGDTGSKSLAHRVVSTFMQHVEFTARPAALGADPVDGESTAQDAWAFWRVGYHAVALSDTGPLRYAHDHAPQDTPNQLDFSRMARVVVGIGGVVRDLAGLPAAK